MEYTIKATEEEALDAIKALPHDELYNAVEYLAANYKEKKDDYERTSDMLEWSRQTKEYYRGLYAGSKKQEAIAPQVGPQHYVRLEDVISKALQDAELAAKPKPHQITFEEVKDWTVKRAKDEMSKVWKRVKEIKLVRR